MALQGYNPYSASTFGPTYILKSRLLAVGCLILIINTLISIVTAILPFWFELTILYRYGSEINIRVYVENWGLYMMDGDSLTSVLQMEKVLTGPTLPGYVRVAQILYMIGLCTTVVCAGTSAILCLYRYGVMAAEMALAFITSSAAVAMIVAVLFAFMLTEAELDLSAWNQFPLDEDLVVQKAFPIAMKIDWAFGLACVSALLELVAAVMFMIHAFISCKGIERIREQQVNRPNKYKPLVEPDVKLRIPQPAAPVQTSFGVTYPTSGYDPTMAVGSEGMVISRGPATQVEPHYRPEPLATNYPSPSYQPASAPSISEEITI